MTEWGPIAPDRVTSSGRGWPCIALVGAGPGDPDLLTLKAVALLGAAAVVVADEEVTDLATAFAPSARLVRIPSSSPTEHSTRHVIVADRPVVRLYLGDTWLHRSHGPERQALMAAGVDFDEVAGVATEIALPAEAGIPVHSRHLSAACTLALAEDAPAPVDASRTLVVAAGDMAAAVSALASTGEPTLAAATLDGSVTRAALGRLADIAPRGRGLVVVGAVAS